MREVMTDGLGIDLNIYRYYHQNMTALKDMYAILEDMVECAEHDQSGRVLELNGLFEKLVPQVYHDPITELDLNYDNCRQSCVMASKMPDMREQFLKDAKERFSTIPKPE